MAADHDIAVLQRLVAYIDGMEGGANGHGRITRGLRAQIRALGGETETAVPITDRLAHQDPLELMFRSALNDSDLSYTTRAAILTAQSFLEA